jgi:hypothetical protein
MDDQDYRQVMVDNHAMGDFPFPAAVTTCGDCGVTPGQPHIPGCDVERCKNCGWQAIGCDCEAEHTVWTGQWPGEAEVEEYGLKDLNELASQAAQGLLTWDREAERWSKRALL